MYGKDKKTIFKSVDFYLDGYFIIITMGYILWRAFVFLSRF